jgi:hypothetical protein
VFSQLAAAHVGERGAAVAGLETQDAALAAQIEMAAHAVADLDRRLGQIDSVIEEAAKRGKTNTALSAKEGQRKARAGLASGRNEAAGTGLPSGRLPIGDQHGSQSVRQGISLRHVPLATGPMGR